MIDPNVLLGTYEYNIEEASQLTLKEAVVATHNILNEYIDNCESVVAQVISTFKLFGDVTADQVYGILYEDPEPNDDLRSLAL